MYTFCFLHPVFGSSDIFIFTVTGDIQAHLVLLGDYSGALIDKNI